MFDYENLSTASLSPLIVSGERRQGWYVMYDVDRCERCGVACQAPNAVNVQLATRTSPVLSQVETFLKAKGQYREELPDELGYSEGYGGAVCTPCHIECEEGGV